MSKILVFCRHCNFENLWPGNTQATFDPGLRDVAAASGFNEACAIAGFGPIRQDYECVCYHCGNKLPFASDTGGAPTYTVTAPAWSGLGTDTHPF